MSYFYASNEYDKAKNSALCSIRAMTTAMNQMGHEHVNFHQHFADAQKQVKELGELYGGIELHAEVVRSTALGPYLSPATVPKVMAFGHMEMEKALKGFEQAELRLSNLEKETARRVEALVENRDYKCEDGQNTAA